MQSKQEHFIYNLPGQFCRPKYLGNFRFKVDIPDVFFIYAI